MTELLKTPERTPPPAGREPAFGQWFTRTVLRNGPLGGLIALVVVMAVLSKDFLTDRTSSTSACRRRSPRSSPSASRS